jgi:hypothetical protein
MADFKEFGMKIASLKKSTSPRISRLNIFLVILNKR